MYALDAAEQVTEHAHFTHPTDAASVGCVGADHCPFLRKSISADTPFELNFISLL